jgi:hypothetical protein
MGCEKNVPRFFRENPVVFGSLRDGFNGNETHPIPFGFMCDLYADAGERLLRHQALDPFPFNTTAAPYPTTDE